MRSVTWSIHVFRKGDDFITVKCPIELRTAIGQQKTIGVQIMVRGFLATGWMDALELAGVKNPERKINTLQALMWDTISEPIWQQRNKLQHAAEN